MKKDNKILLEHVREAISRIEEYTQNIDFDTFTKSRLVQDGVIRNLAIVGEAVKHLESSLKDQHPEIPWPQIVAMRNIITHEYFGIDLRLTWDVINSDLPTFKKEVEKLWKTLLI